MAADGRRADIIKCHPFQPEISDHLNYSAYLWVKAIQGYFLLRQRFIEEHPCEWRIVREVEVEDPERDFFDEMGRSLMAEFATT